MDIIKKQIQEIEQENKLFNEEQTNENISNILARQKQKERGFKIRK